MKNVKDICEEIGRQRLASLLDVKRSAVTNAINHEVFPSSWYKQVKKACDEKGISCPMSLFSWRARSPGKVKEK